MTNLLFAPPALGTVLSLTGLPGGSNKIHDRGPYGKIGTITGATWKRLPSGLWYLHLDGGDDYVNLGIVSAAALTAYTIKVWVNSDDAPATYEAILKGTTNVYGPAVEIHSANKIRVVADGADGWLTGNTVLTSGEWYMVTAVFNDKYKGIYINGSLDIDETDPTYSATWDTTGHLLGAHGTTPAAFFDGKLALLTILNRAWTALDVQNAFNQEKHLFGVW